jgi:hypothetical protein
MKQRSQNCQRVYEKGGGGVAKRLADSFFDDEDGMIRIDVSDYMENQ